MGRTAHTILKAGPRRADSCLVRLERLVIDSGERTLTADFHPSLTVVGGLEPAMRDALVGEVIDSMAGARPGVHLELQHAGRSLTVFRPAGGRHRVVDTDDVADVTADYLGRDGEIDLFAAAGVDRALGRRTIRVTRDDLVLRSESDAWIARLCRVDQAELWETATRYRAAEALLERASNDAGASVDDALMVREIEQKHASFVAATETYDRIRLISLTMATIGGIAAAASTQLEGSLNGLVYLLFTVVGAGLAVWYRRVMNQAAADEREVLRHAGADDYSAFQFERVSALLDTDNERRSFMLAVSDHRKAAADWEAIAGKVPLSFALEHERHIRAAAELQSGSGSLQVVAATGAPADADVVAELAQAVLARIEAVRALTDGDDDLPLVLDDPFEGLDPSLKPSLLEMLTAQAGNVQLVIVTADADVTAWAQVEAMTGGLSVVEPTVARAATA